VQLKNNQSIRQSIQFVINVKHKLQLELYITNFIYSFIHKLFYDAVLSGEVL